jgi:hypothetical protein
VRLGFVGVGRWAQKLASAFRACGAEIVAHDRRGGERIDNFGIRLGWEEMIRDARVDGMVVTTDDPQLNLEVGTRCIETRMPVVVTKPFQFAEHLSPQSPCMVDLWRLWDPGYLRLAAYVKSNYVRSLKITLRGNGPKRTYIDGAQDYGPHALAWLIDLTQGNYSILEKRYRHGRGADVTFRSPICNEIRVSFGNDAVVSERRIEADIGGGESLVWEEFGDKVADPFPASVANSTALTEMGPYTTWDGVATVATRGTLVTQKSATVQAFALDFMAAAKYGRWSRWGKSAWWRESLRLSCASQELLGVLASRERLAAE